MTPDIEVINPSIPRGKIRCAVFDFDGTLVDSRLIGLEIYNTIAARQGFLHALQRGLQRVGNAAHGDVGGHAGDHDEGERRRQQALAGLDHVPHYLPGSAEGMGGTLRDGVAALPPCPRFPVRRNSRTGPQKPASTGRTCSR